MHPVFGQLAPLGNPPAQPVVERDPHSMDLDDYELDSPPRAGRESTGLESLLSSVLGMKDGPVFGETQQVEPQASFWSKVKRRGKRD